MKLLFLIFITLLSLIKYVESRWSATPGSTWAYLINSKDDVILNRSEQVITIDLNKSPELIEKLHKQGKKVICYFSGGTIENHRDDKDDYFAVDGLVVDKEGRTKFDELWLDYRREEIKPLIKRRMQRALNNKCDGIEVDCLGAYNHKIVTERWENPLTKEDAYNFAKMLSKMAHEVGISIGLKNVADLAPYLVNDFDFAVVESCSMSKKICAKYENFPKSGKAVFTIHYGNYGSFSEQKSTMISELKGFGYTCTFNENDNLKTPGYNFNCDNGSTSNLKGVIPSVERGIVVGTPTFSKKATTTTKKATTTKKTTTKRTTTTTRRTTTTTKKTTKKTTTTVANKPKTTTKPVTKKTTTTKRPTTTKRATTTRRATTSKRVTTTRRATTTRRVTTTRRTTTTRKTTRKTTTTRRTTRKTTTKPVTKKTTRRTTKKSTNKKATKKATKAYNKEQIAWIRMLNFLKKNRKH